MNTKALRQKILDLAIHGKLVPQDPNDEPASVLLEHIRAKKERLIKEGKIKKPKKSKAACDKPHYPFELPKGWEWCRLEDYVFSVTDGDHQAPPNVSKGIPFLVISNIADGSLDFSNTRYVPEEYYEKIQMERKPKRGDILFSVTGSYGIVVNIKTDRQFCFQRHIGLIKPTISNEYLSFVLKSNYIKSLCDKLATGTAQKTVGLDTLRSLYVPIAPIEEQERIVAKIKHLFLQISFLEAGNGKLVAAIKQAKSKILELAIHGNLVPQDSNDEPASELLKRINPKAEITCDNPQYGKLPSGWCLTEGKYLYKPMKSAKPKGLAFNYIDIDSIDNTKQRIDSVKVVKTENAPSRASRYTQKGDIVFSMVRPYLKNIAMIPDNDCIASTGFYVCSPSDVAVDKYCYYLMISDYTVNGLNQYMKGDNSPSINKGDIDSWLFPIPPLQEQHRIVAKIEELFAQLDKIEASL